MSNKPSGGRSVDALRRLGELCRDVAEQSDLQGDAWKLIGEQLQLLPLDERAEIDTALRKILAFHVPTLTARKS